MTAGTWKLQLLLAMLSVACACTSPDPAFLDSQGRPLDERGPAPYRIALAPLDTAAGPIAKPPPVEGALHFTFTPEQVQQELAQALRELNAASSVVIVGARDREEAGAQRADLLIRTRVRSPAHLEHVGRSDNWLTGGVLWLTTWLGSFFVEDSTYDADMAVEFEIVNPYDGLVIDSVTASSGTKDLDFWDRHPAVSWGLLQSIIIPPFWTSDDAETTSESLSRTMCRRLAARLAQYLVEDLGATENDFLGQLRLESPANGAIVGDRVSVKGKLISREPLTDVSIYVDDSVEPALEMSGKSMPSTSEQLRGSVFQVRLDQSIALSPGTHLIALEIGISGWRTSRTLIVHSEPGGPP